MAETARYEGDREHLRRVAGTMAKMPMRLTLGRVPVLRYSWVRSQHWSIRLG